MFDCVIRGGTVIDGTGAPAQEMDVALKDGLVAAVGAKLGAGREEIDARDHLVTPGFVDIHTHFDGQVTWDPFLSPSTGHGVTTVVMGNCGVGFAPCAPERHWLAQKTLRPSKRCLNWTSPASRSPMVMEILPGR